VSVGWLLAVPSSDVRGANEHRKVYGYRIEFAIFLGGSEWEEAREVIVLADRSILVGGQTSSEDFPVTDGVVQPKYCGEPAGTGHGGLYSGDMFLTRFSRDGKRFVASTYFGGSRQERSVYGDGFLTRLSADRNPFTFSTCGGGGCSQYIRDVSADLDLRTRLPDIEFSCVSPSNLRRFFPFVQRRAIERRKHKNRFSAYLVCRSGNLIRCNLRALFQFGTAADALIAFRPKPA